MITTLWMCVTIWMQSPTGQAHGLMVQEIPMASQAFDRQEQRHEEKMCDRSSKSGVNMFCVN